VHGDAGIDGIMNGEQPADAVERNVTHRVACQNGDDRLSPQLP
jgi:hypothetical protein